MKLADINVRDPFFYIENGVTYLYRTLHSYAENEIPDECGFCVFVSKDGENFEKKVIFKATSTFWADQDFWAPEMHKIGDKYYLFGTAYKEGKRRASHIFVCDTPDGVFLPMEKQLTPPEWDCLDATYFEENGERYTLFCHEWLQIQNGEICLSRLDENLKPCGEVKTLFQATDAPWVRSIYPDKGCYVTDGPFVYRLKSGKLLMLWSSFGERGYAVGMATADKIDGKWKQIEKPLIEENGGHAMLFEKEGRLFISYHVPNNPNGAERACVREVVDNGEFLDLNK